MDKDSLGPTSKHPIAFKRGINAVERERERGTLPKTGVMLLPSSSSQSLSAAAACFSSLPPS